MIDTDAFGEWIVAKAEKLGAFTSVENLRIAREAVEIALARDGDDIHVTCVLAGASGAIPIDERMTRTAVGVLFPKVTIAHPVHLFEPRPEPRPKAPPPRASDDYELEARRRSKRALDRKLFIVVLAVFALVFAGTAVAVALHEREHEEAPSRSKREMRH
jgi:hypothetical protein